MAWTIAAARACPSLERVVLTTDDAEIAEAGRRAGADVPFLRPAELAKDDTPDFPVFRHAVEWLEENEKFRADIVVWLRPTAPLRAPEDVEKAVRLLRETNADTVRSVCSAEHHPYWMKRLEGDKLKPFVEGHDETNFFRRQNLPPVYRLNGAVDVVRCKSALERGTLFGGDVRGYVMPHERSLDLDTENDFEMAELTLRRTNA